MKPLFVSYNGQIEGKWSQGWVVLVNYPALEDARDMTHLAEMLEKRGYDPGTLVLNNFRRLE